MMSNSRRRFIRNSLFNSLGLALGANIVYANKIPFGNELVGLGQDSDSLIGMGKDPGLTILNDRPWNVETPPHLLDDRITPGDKLFIRNNGIPPKNVSITDWTLTVDGESVKSKKTYTLADLKSRFTQHTYQLTLECGGNGRSEFNPPAGGNQWTTGAVGCPEWTGIRLLDVLEDVGIKDDAVYIGYYGADTHLSADPGKHAISRGVPIEKALEEESLIAWGLNGNKLPHMNGFPLRLVFGGWPASTSGKWLERISIRNKIHDGEKMGGQSYRVPCNSVSPGSDVEDDQMCIIESMPVKSIITFPKTGATLPMGSTLSLRGHAWAGDYSVKKMEISKDFGSTWGKCQLETPKNRHAWQHWNIEIDFMKKGYYEVWAKATDSIGKSQPMVVPGWNPKGYLNNATHRIAVKVV